MEHSERWLLDADITIDYAMKTIIFVNKKKLFSKKYLKQIIIVNLVLPIILSIVISLSPEFCFIRDWYFYVVIFVTLSLIFMRDFVSSMNIRFFRDLGMKRRTRNTLRELRIQNPEGVIQLDTVSTDPFFDVEYTEEVRKALQTLELKKLEKKKRRFFARGNRKTRLTITLSGKPNGELVIKEY